MDDSLIAKFLAGEATPEEAMLMSDWIDQSPENKFLFDQSQQVWAMQNNLVIIKTDKAKAWKTISENISPSKSIPLFFTPFRIAASIILIATSALVVYLWKPTAVQQDEWIVKNSHQEISTVALSEGTSIVLNKNSTLVYPIEFRGPTRTINLSGEAFFDVTHNSNKPFVINYEDINIKVLGTAFNIRYLENSGSVETQVTRGKVMMYDQNNSIIINEGWTGIYERSTKKLSLRKTKTANNLGYATHTLTFEDTSLKEVTDNLSESYGVVFVFENEKLKDCHLTSSYKNKPLSFILDVIAESLNLEYIVKGNTVYLSGNGCL